MKRSEQAAETLIQLNKAATEPENGRAVAKVAEAEYSLQELVAGAEMFSIKPECMLAALRTAGLKTATKQQALKIVKAFMERSVG